MIPLAYIWYYRLPYPHTVVVLQVHTIVRNILVHMVHDLPSGASPGPRAFGSSPLASFRSPGPNLVKAILSFLLFILLLLYPPTVVLLRFVQLRVSCSKPLLGNKYDSLCRSRGPEDPCLFLCIKIAQTAFDSRPAFFPPSLVTASDKVKRSHSSLATRLTLLNKDLKREKKKQGILKNGGFTECCP
jgi:hypothetical protein